MSPTEQMVTTIARPVVEEQDLQLVAVEYQKEGEQWYLRVFIENPEGGLDHTDCVDVSRTLGALLDQEDVIQQDSYILEVSSPGLERPLKTKKDFQKYTGKNIYIKSYANISGKKEFTGKLIAYIPDDDVVTILENKGVIRIPFTKIAKANLTVEF